MTMAAVGTPDTFEVDASGVPPELLAHVSTWLAGEIAPRLDLLAACALTPDAELTSDDAGRSDAADTSLIAYSDTGHHRSNRPGPRPTWARKVGDAPVEAEVDGTTTIVRQIARLGEGAP
jgi:hypothetical protein